MAKLEIRDKNRWTLVLVEIIIISILGAHWMTKKWSWDTFTAIIAAIVMFLAIAALFFGVRIFRYIFSIAFSLFWGMIAYGFADGMSKSNVTPWVTGLLVVVISLALHKDYFRFETS